MPLKGTSTCPSRGSQGTEGRISPSHPWLSGSRHVIGTGARERPEKCPLGFPTTHLYGSLIFPGSSFHKVTGVSGRCLCGNFSLTTLSKELKCQEQVWGWECSQRTGHLFQFWTLTYLSCVSWTKLQFSASLVSTEWGVPRPSLQDCSEH